MKFLFNWNFVDPKAIPDFLSAYYSSISSLMLSRLQIGSPSTRPVSRLMHIDGHLLPSVHEQWWVWRPACWYRYRMCRQCRSFVRNTIMLYKQRTARLYASSCCTLTIRFIYFLQIKVEFLKGLNWICFWDKRSVESARYCDDKT